MDAVSEPSFEPLVPFASKRVVLPSGSRMQIVLNREFVKFIFKLLGWTEEKLRGTIVKCL